MKLKPCPFCGGKNVEFGKNYFMTVIECHDCRASIEIEGTEIDVIESWNTRAKEEKKKKYIVSFSYKVCPFIRKIKKEPVTCCITFEECNYADLSKPRDILCPLIEI